ncbi:mediator of RNA polymerase II transcription subunit 13 [Caerostris extrusa]|uniref:Mediator of RNA polymerase II transcription subunit 13 n=1 Tax=Caerostris extrusa TaxID=172846 RepID=A0AAV4Y6L2_CAEEX|nr:mediator of RNA polymerase II transcription subunit 13 [Caerostris extrusa]
MKVEIKEEESSNSQNNCNSNNSGVPSNNSNNWAQEPVEEAKTFCCSNFSIFSAYSTFNSCSGIKRPALTVCSHEDPHDELLMDGLLYDYAFLNNPLWENTSMKRRRLWPERSIKTETFENGEQHYYGNDRSNSMQIDDCQPLKPKDPYEFNDEFDEDSPSSTGFRARVDRTQTFHYLYSFFDFFSAFREEDIKPKDPNLPPTP